MNSDIMPLFASFELAKLAAEKGFSKGCLAWYTPDTGEFRILAQDHLMMDQETGNIMIDPDPFYYWHTTFKTPEIVQAPMYSQIMDWLREGGRMVIMPVHKDTFYAELERYLIAILKTLPSAGGIS